MKRKTHSAVRLFVLAMLCCCTLTDVSAQVVTVSNNLLYDGALTPNLRVGLRLAPHWSVGMTAGYRPWPKDDTTTRKQLYETAFPEDEQIPRGDLMRLVGEMPLDFTAGKAARV